MYTRPWLGVSSQRAWRCSSPPVRAGAGPQAGARGKLLRCFVAPTVSLNPLAPCVCWWSTVATVPTVGGARELAAASAAFPACARSAACAAASGCAKCGQCGTRCTRCSPGYSLWDGACYKHCPSSAQYLVAVVSRGRGLGDEEGLQPRWRGTNVTQLGPLASCLPLPLAGCSV